MSTTDELPSALLLNASALEIGRISGGVPDCILSDPECARRNIRLAELHLVDRDPAVHGMLADAVEVVRRHHAGAADPVREEEGAFECPDCATVLPSATARMYHQFDKHAKPAPHAERIERITVSKRLGRHGDARRVVVGPLELDVRNPRFVFQTGSDSKGSIVYDTVFYAGSRVAMERADFALFVDEIADALLELIVSR